MKIDKLPIGQYQENIFILHDNGHVLIIDPGRYPAEIRRHIRTDETVDAILLTHGHHDHTGAVDDLYDIYGCPVYIHDSDRVLTDSKSRGIQDLAGWPVYAPMSSFAEGENTIGTFTVDVMFTPGHTSGSVIIRYRNVLFTGDTLFAGTIGRTDLYSGNDMEMAASLTKILSCDDDLRVLSGHGADSTIHQEKLTNPYLRMVAKGVSLPE